MAELCTRIAIPGPWTKRSDLVAAVRQSAPGYVLAGRVIKHAATVSELAFAQNDPDPELSETFARLRYDSGMSDAELQAVAGHARCVWLAGAYGSEPAAELLRWSTPFVAAGGQGVLVATAGKVHRADAWLQLAQHPTEPDVLWAAFVALNRHPDGSYYSSGMQHLGLPDATLPDRFEPARAGEILRTFQVHLIKHRPTLAAGQTFQAPGDELKLGLTFAASPFATDHVQNNPFGAWALA